MTPRPARSHSAAPPRHRARLRTRPSDAAPQDATARHRHPNLRHRPHPRHRGSPPCPSRTIPPHRSPSHSVAPPGPRARPRRAPPVPPLRLDSTRLARRAPLTSPPGRAPQQITASRVPLPGHRAGDRPGPGLPACALPLPFAFQILPRAGAHQARPSGWQRQPEVAPTPAPQARARRLRPAPPARSAPASPSARHRASRHLPTASPHASAA